MRSKSAALALVACLIPRPGAAGQQPDQTSWLGHIGSRQEFDLLARVNYGERFHVLPHVMFIIDRRDGQVYYINSKLYAFHRDFVNAIYLSLERGLAFYENSYRNPERRFLLGTVAHHPAEDKFAYEFWEGDLLTRQLLLEAHSALSRTFFAPLCFKPNSQAQRDAAPGSVPLFEASDDGYQPFSVAAADGQLHVVDRLTEDVIIGRNQIVIFKEVPLRLTPVSGIILSEPTSPLSHINMLARSWGIPSAYIKGAEGLFRSLEGKYVRLEVSPNGYKLAPADPKQVSERNLRWMRRADSMTPGADLEYSRLTNLDRQRSRDSEKFGAKSANLGEIINRRIGGIVVPRGFTIPFYHYNQFLRRNGLEDRIAAALEEDRFVHDPKYRRQKLAEIRSWIQAGQHDPWLKRAVLTKIKREYAGKSLFVRSSTNAEDLTDFSGAGLYTTVPNVRTREQLLEAIKTVWASVWNYEAYEARESYGMNHMGVYMAVLIQEGIEADSAGVAITRDPFNPANRSAVYINAKRGLGIRVVEGRRIPEQILYDPSSGSIRVLTRSDDDTMLAFDEKGGIREIKIEERRAVLTDSMIRSIALAALQIERAFGGIAQDIEWLCKRNKLYIVQSRPYVAQQPL
jgi:hypothetical protein